MLSHSGIRPSDADIIEIARDGDRVIHKNEGAGRIDVNTSFYGGFVSFSSETGARREELSATPDLLLIDTGPKKSTAEMVQGVRNLYDSNREKTEHIFAMIDECTNSGLDALHAKDAKALGAHMSIPSSSLSVLLLSFL